MTINKIILYLGLFILSFFGSLLGALLLKWWICLAVLFIFGCFILEDDHCWWLAFWLGIFQDFFWGDYLGRSSLLFLGFVILIKYVFSKLKQRQIMFGK